MKKPEVPEIPEIHEEELENFSSDADSDSSSDKEGGDEDWNKTEEDAGNTRYNVLCPYLARPASAGT